MKSRTAANGRRECDSGINEGRNEGTQCVVPAPHEAVTAVPEPSVWALLILGLSALSLSGVQSLLWLNGETARQREHALLVAA